jgi:polyhydroxyalkanoate synthase
MAERPTFKPADVAEVARVMASLARHGQRVGRALLARQGRGGGFQVSNSSVVGKAFLRLGVRVMADPLKLAGSVAELMRALAEVRRGAVRRLANAEVVPVAVPAKDDRRFRDDAWTDEVVFDVIKQSYLLATRWIENTVQGAHGLDKATARKVNFYTRQLVDALSPSNFAVTNPTVLAATLESGGLNLLKGLDNLLADLERGGGQLRISMTDSDAFTLGGNVAATPGKVVYQNDLMQLIQYAPSTETVHACPLLIMPPWINKYYVLDLQPRNSFIKWAVDQGLTVFVISWVNPDEHLADKSFDDYMKEGPLEALEAIERATGQREVNVIGYCIGGTLLACTLAYVADASGKDGRKWKGRVKSATYFTAMVDFEEAGELAVFVDEEQLARLEAHMNEKGYLEGRHMATVFNMMRDKDLIWSFVINNYLLGRDPPPFDLLYWNSDSTRMPAMMHSFYLRNMYLENRLVEPGGISLAGVPIDLGAIKVPTYILATREDHIAPWQSVYAATGHYGGAVKFVLSASGHIAGVVNPPTANKYGYWTNSRKPKNADAWLESAKRHDGSWWRDWGRWVARHAGPKTTPARRPGAAKLKVIEDAPGSYVKVRG